MKRSEYSLLSLSVWFIASQLAEGWFSYFAQGMAIGWTIVFALALFSEYRDARNRGEWQETWHR